MKTLAVGPDGDAVIWVTTSGGAHFLRRIPLGTALPWERSILHALNSVPVVDPALAVVVPMWELRAATPARRTWSVSRTSMGTPAGRHDLVMTVFNASVIDPAPPASLNPSGSIVYFPDVTMSKQSRVFACSTTSSFDCTPMTAGNKWVSDLVPQAAPPAEVPIWTARPFAKGSRIAAITTSATYFLNADTGKRVAWASGVEMVVLAAGGLVAAEYQAGLGREFWMLNGPPGGTGAQEIIGIDTVEAGEVYRYQIASGDLTAAVDDAGEIRLRIAGKMVRPYSMADYRRGLAH